MSDASIKQRGRRKNGVLVAALVVILALMAWGVSMLLGGKSTQAPKPPKITLMTPALPPPPPPPPPKEEKKPDPPKEQKELKVEQPVPKQAPPQPSPELKMDGPAGDGPSAFAAGKITSDDVSKIGSGKVGGGVGGEKSGMFNPFNNYANLLKGEVQRYLGKNNALRRRHYTVEVDVWVSAGGELKRYELKGSTGDGDTDEAIKQAMSSLSGFSQKLPANMPQPIRLRIVTAG